MTTKYETFRNWLLTQTKSAKKLKPAYDQTLVLFDSLYIKEKEENKSYIVAWMEGKDIEHSKDKYKVFIDADTGAENKEDAWKFYRKLLKKDKVVSANIAHLKGSTDYTI